jgi:hypothetical protein
MEIEAYLVEYSDDRIEWRKSSIHLHLSRAVEAAEKIPYPTLIRFVLGNSLNLVSKKEIDASKKITDTLTKLFQ